MLGEGSGLDGEPRGNAADDPREQPRTTTMEGFGRGTRVVVWRDNPKSDQMCGVVQDKNWTDGGCKSLLPSPSPSLPYHYVGSRPANRISFVSDHPFPAIYIEVLG